MTRYTSGRATLEACAISEALSGPDSRSARYTLACFRVSPSWVRTSSSEGYNSKGLAYHKIMSQLGLKWFVSVDGGAIH